MKYKGFTLLEMSLYVVIAVTIIGGVVGFLFVALQAKIKHRSISEVEAQGQFLLTQILEDIDEAKRVITPGDGASTSSLAIERLDGTIVQYNVVDGVAGITENINPREVLTSPVVFITSVTFEELGPIDAGESVRVEFDIEFTSTSPRNEYKYEQTFYGTATPSIY